MGMMIWRWNFFNGPLFEGNWKVLEGFFRALDVGMFCHYIITNLLIIFATCMPLLLLPLVYFPNKIKLKKITQNSLKNVFWPWNRGKCLPSLVLFWCKWHKCWNWPNMEDSIKNLSESPLLVTLRLTLL